MSSAEELFRKRREIGRAIWLLTLLLVVAEQRRVHLGLGEWRHADQRHRCGRRFSSVGFHGRALAGETSSGRNDSSVSA